MQWRIGNSTLWPTMEHHKGGCFSTARSMSTSSLCFFLMEDPSHEQRRCISAWKALECPVKGIHTASTLYDNAKYVKACVCMCIYTLYMYEYRSNTLLKNWSWRSIECWCHWCWWVSVRWPILTNSDFLPLGVQGDKVISATARIADSNPASNKSWTKQEMTDANLLYLCRHM